MLSHCAGQAGLTRNHRDTEKEHVAVALWLRVRQRQQRGREPHRPAAGGGSAHMRYNLPYRLPLAAFAAG
jgi:hypothetical protein